MLGGEYRHKLDNKGRVSMPAKFRNELGSSFVVTRGLTEKCLFVFPLKIWDKYVSAYESLSTLTDNDVREFGRLFFGRASDCDVDAQGRINIPQNLREFADLKEDIVIVKSPVGMPGRAILNKFMKERMQSNEKVQRCYKCIKKCDPKTTPYCITKALRNAVEGNIDEALVFCGENAAKVDKITTVKAIIDEMLS